MQLLYTTRNATTVVAVISWRGNAEIVHTQWHNSFKTTPTHRVATDILRLVAVRYSPDTDPPPVRLNVSPVGHPPYRVVDTGVVETYPDLTGRPRVISRTDTCAAAAYRFASRDFLHFCFFNFTHGVNSMIFGIRCDISSIALFFSSIPLYLYLP